MHVGTVVSYRKPEKLYLALNERVSGIQARYNCQFHRKDDLFALYIRSPSRQLVGTPVHGDHSRISRVK